MQYSKRSIRDSFGKNEARRTAPRQARARGHFMARRVRPLRRKRGQSASIPRHCCRILHSESGANTLISLKLTGEHDTRVLVKDYQLDPVTHQVLHADFYRIAMDRAIQVTIPVVVKGEPKGVKQQGAFSNSSGAKSRSSACLGIFPRTSRSTSAS